LVIGPEGPLSREISSLLPSQRYDLKMANGMEEGGISLANEAIDAVILDLVEGVRDDELAALLRLSTSAPTVAVIKDADYELIHGLVELGVQEVLSLDGASENSMDAAIKCAMARLNTNRLDSVTGLLNRALLRDRLQLAISQARRYDHQVAVMFLDLDRFKMVNDSFGHETGDRILRSVAARLREVLRDSDTVARLGADTFIVVIPNLPHAHFVTKVAEKMTDALSKATVIEDQEITLTASIGISMFPGDADTADDLIQRADVAMQQVKEQGGDAFRFFQSDLHSDAINRLSMAFELRRAVEKGDFELYYQPQMDLFENKVVGVEALIRWHHEDFGQVPPDVFVPLAEEIGVMVQMGDWVLETACRQRREWFDQGLPAFRVAVNLSAHQFSSDGLLTHVEDYLKQYYLNPEYLEVELTESSVMRDPEATRRALLDLSGAGVRVAIDDFGTGYSSLSYLKRFPLDVLKIDRSFVNEITTDSYGAAIARTIITLADNLNLHSVAEGIETTEQLDFLRANGCGIGQGYLIARPMPASELPAVVNQLNATGIGNDQDRFVALV
jgi:diguanylate cyclase (GGDEF)-like protein